MNVIVKFASGFMGLFDTGAQTFIGWVSGIVPKVLLLLNFNEHHHRIGWTGQESTNLRRCALKMLFWLMGCCHLSRHSC